MGAAFSTKKFKNIKKMVSTDAMSFCAYHLR